MYVASWQKYILYHKYSLLILSFLFVNALNLVVNNDRLQCALYTEPLKKKIGWTRKSNC